MTLNTFRDRQATASLLGPHHPQWEQFLPNIPPKPSVSQLKATPPCPVTRIVFVTGSNPTSSLAWWALPQALFPPARTYDSQVGAGSNARDNVGGNTLPLAVVVLAEGADLQGPSGQRVVLAPAGLPYLGQGAG